MQIAIIAAVAQNRVIGIRGKIPWDLPEDRKRFRKMTLNHPVIMGRATYESLPCTLDQRTSIVLTRDPAAHSNQQRLIANSLIEAIELAHKTNPEKTFIIGGEQIYRQAISTATLMHLTELRQGYYGDRLFPEFDRQREWREVKREEHGKFAFVDYEKVSQI